MDLLRVGRKHTEVSAHLIRIRRLEGHLRVECKVVTAMPAAAREKPSWDRLVKALSLMFGCRHLLLG